jgi:D-glycero-D-manno-heptose 1,7-bisphosphate phosphatase
MNKSRALFLDRDGVVNSDAGYVGSIERFAFMPGLFPFLRAARDRGYRLAILTNQSGVARGLFSESDYHKVTDHMLSGLRHEAIEIELTLACFVHPDATVAGYGFESFWRKPNPGMILEAIRRMNADPARSAFIGDSARDMQAARDGGIQTRLWLTQAEQPAQDGVTVVSGFTDALASL